MSDGFQPLTVAQIQTPDGISQLNNIIQTLYANMAGDGVSVSTFYGVGSPEGALTAGIGSIYLRTDGGTNTSLYRKESGTGNTGWVATSSVTVPISVANGGTGSDNSLTVQGVIPYFSATGVISGLATGTSGQFLQTQGASADPQWAPVPSPSNYLFQYSGAVDFTSSDHGEFSGTSLVPTSPTGMRFLVATTTGAQVWESKFIKTSGVNTITIWCRIWGNSNQTTLSINVGGQSGNVTGTNTETTPTWKSFTINVSSLTNGSTYDVAATLSSNSGWGYCSNIIGFGS